MTTTTGEIHQAVTYVKVELLNIDGSTLGFARIRLADRAMRESLGHTLGVGYTERVTLPVGDLGDPRCPYSLRVVAE
jgi:hypothetical protein